MQESPIETQFREAAVGRITGLEPQQWIGGYRVDFLVRAKRLVIELDGHDFHKTKEQRTHDAARQRKLQSLGYTVIRFTGTEVFKDAGSCVQQTLTLLAKRPDFVGDSESTHPECYYCVRLQEAITGLLLRHRVGLDHPYCYYRFELPGPWDPLSVEKHGEVVSVKHFTVEGGDIVFDPMVEFAIIGGRRPFTMGAANDAKLRALFGRRLSCRGQGRNGHRSGSAGRNRHLLRNLGCELPEPRLV